MSRAAIVPARVTQLIERFGNYVLAFDHNPPFTHEQLHIHQSVIRQRRELGGVRQALATDAFVRSLRDLLVLWGMDSRKASLVDPPIFANNLRASADSIASLENISLDNLDRPSLETKVIPQLAAIISTLTINENKAKIVVGFKALHHLLPDLVPPVDREYTGRFFGWHAPYFQTRQPQLVTEAMITFSQIARSASPHKFIGPGWRTSQSKVIDNAIVAFCRCEDLPRPS